MIDGLFDTQPASADPTLGFSLGWDHARHGVAPAMGLMQQASPVRLGFGAARLRFAGRTLKPSAHVRQWLALRTRAWLEGAAFEEGQLTANFVRQLAASHCPVLRLPLAGQGVLWRPNAQAAYAAGNLAMVAPEAAAAMEALAWHQAWQRARAVEAGHAADAAGAMDAAAWRRAAVLMSFTTPLPHAVAARLPLLVMPANRLRVLNPAQGVQVLLTRLLARPGWTPHLRRWAARLGDTPARHELHRLAVALLARLLPCKAGPGEPANRHAMEDAWACERVQRHWLRFAQGLNEAQMRALLADAQAAGWAKGCAVWPSRARATEGWALGSEGRRVQAGPLSPREPGACPTEKSLRPLRSTPFTSHNGRLAKFTGTPDWPLAGFSPRSNTEVAGM